MEPNPRPRALAEWKAHWPVVAASTLGGSVLGLYVFTGGLFVAPLEKEFGWSRGTITSGVLICSVFGMLFAPVMGSVIDRVGPRRIAVAGILTYLGAFALLATNQGSVYQWWAMWALLACGVVLLQPTVWALAIASEFDRGRGLALSIAQCGGGLGGIFAPLVGVALVTRYGWRAAFVGIAATWLVVTLPPVYLLFRTRLDRPRTRTTGAAPGEGQSISARAGLRSPIFIKMMVISTLTVLTVGGLVYHYIPMLTERGLARETAAEIAALFGIASVAGRLLTGYLLDRISGSIVGLIAFLPPAIACSLLFALPTTPAVAVVAALLIGVTFGSEVDVLSYFASRYFGLANFGLLFGFIAGSMSIAFGMGSTLGGVIHDSFKSYDYLLGLCIPTSVLCSILAASLGPYPDEAG